MLGYRGGTRARPGTKNRICGNFQDGLRSKNDYNCASASGSSFPPLPSYLPTPSFLNNCKRGQNGLKTSQKPLIIEPATIWMAWEVFGSFPASV